MLLTIRRTLTLFDKPGSQRTGVNELLLKIPFPLSLTFFRCYLSIFIFISQQALLHSLIIVHNYHEAKNRPLQNFLSFSVIKISMEYVFNTNSSN
jgi:hypothetical protein